MTATLPAPRLITDRLEHWASTTPDAPALIYRTRRWTFAEFYGDVQRAAAALRGAGVGPGDHIAVFDKNHPSCLQLTFAAASIGAANAVVNWRLSPDELAYVIDNSAAVVLFVGAEFADTVAAIADRLPRVRQVVTVGGESDEYEQWLDSGTTVPSAGQPGPGRDPGPEDTCLLLYTSGTTGYPKGAQLTHRGLAAHTTNVSSVFRFGEGDVNLVAMPLFHVGGSSYSQFGFHHGVPTVLTREPDAASLFGALAAGASHAFLVPAVIAGIVAAGDRAMAAMSTLRYLGYGASPMPLPLLRTVLAAWPDMHFIQVYGMTELAGVVTTLDPDDHRDSTHPERLASAGRPIPGVRMRLVDPVLGTDVGPGETGELWFATDQLMAGYWDNPEATAAAITDGWLRSGDIARLDDEGFVFIVDRIKDMIISGGENIYSPEVERMIGEHPAVAEVAVIGIPDETWGEAVRAVVAPYPGKEIDPEELIQFCRGQLAHYKCPRTVEVMAALPRNGTGKILKRSLREPFWTGRDRAV
jgi:acyl-CoA synthetase (AMP-forming)/AMP-acid ligase II